MPNWCSGTLLITGPAADIKRFKDRASKGRKILNENSFIPYPSKFKKLDQIAIKITDKRNKLIEKLISQDKESEVAWKEATEQIPFIKDGFNQGGHDWCIEHWGTKWGFCDPEITDESSEKLAYRFDTAWSPIISVIKKMGKMFPSLSFEYEFEEPGMDFSGYFVVEKGTVTHQEYADCPQRE